MAQSTQQSMQVNNDSQQSSEKLTINVESPRKKPSQNSFDTPSKPSPAHNTIPSPSPIDSAAKLDRDSRTLNLVLESALLCTARRDSATSSIIYLEDITEGFLNSSNVSEAICSRLASNLEILNAISYLCNTYKRLVSKESTASSTIQPEISK